ncbi:putative nitrous oxide reductase [Helianthus anomalus]
MRILDDKKIIVVNQFSCAIRYVDHESPKCVLGTNVHIPFRAHPYNVLFLAILDGIVLVCLINARELVVWNPLTHVFEMLSNSNSQGFYSVDDDSIGFCVDFSGDYNIVHINARISSWLLTFIYLYFLWTKFWCVGNAEVLHLDVDSKIINYVGFPDIMGVEAIG